MKKITKDMTDYDNEIYKTISRNIKYYRYNNKSKYADKYGKITQEKLAELCDVSLGLISNIESEKVHQTFSIAILYRIARVLNIDIKEFFNER